MLTESISVLQLVLLLFLQPTVSSAQQPLNKPNLAITANIPVHTHTAANRS